MLFIKSKKVDLHSCIIYFPSVNLASSFNFHFSELGTMLPSSGGEYTYTLEAFGPVAAFVILWVNVLLVRPAAQAVVALACAEYAVDLWFPNCTPPKIAVILLAAAVLGEKLVYKAKKSIERYVCYTVPQKSRNNFENSTLSCINLLL